MTRVSRCLIRGASKWKVHRPSGGSFVSGAKPLPTVFQASRNTKHESRDTAFVQSPLEPRPCRLSRFWGHETRDTEHETRLYRLGSLPTISHDFPPFPTISQVPPPKKNQVPLRIAATGSSASWMHRVAAQPSPACMSRHAGRRGACGSRVTAFPSRASAVGW